MNINNDNGTRPPEKMGADFFKYLHQRQNKIAAVPSNDKIAGWALGLLDLLFPERRPLNNNTVAEIDELFQTSAAALLDLLEQTKVCDQTDNQAITTTFFESLPFIYRLLRTDSKAICDGDPAAQSEFEVIRTYPGFFAISLYRIAHALLRLGVPVLPRVLTECAHSRTGIDIHPGATIGEYFCIDHGTGVVIGETTHIGKHVKVYQGVTLGALSVDKNETNRKRHPTIGDRVVIYAGATILGGDTVIGDDSVVGGNVWLTSSIPPHSTAYHQPTVKIVETKNGD